LGGTVILWVKLPLVLLVTSVIEAPSNEIFTETLGLKPLPVRVICAPTVVVAALEVMDGTMVKEVVAALRAESVEDTI
jgi:hypothetical protein